MKKLLDEYLNKGPGIEVKEYFILLSCFYFVPLVLINVFVEMLRIEPIHGYFLKIILGLIPLYYGVSFILRFTCILKVNEMPFRVFLFYPLLFVGIITSFFILSVSLVSLGFRTENGSKNLFVGFIGISAILYGSALGYFIWNYFRLLRLVY